MGMPNFFDNFLEGQENWPKERYGAYAPGNYVCICRNCKGVFYGDKRSMMCYPCVIAEEKKNIQNNLGAGI